MKTVCAALPTQLTVITHGSSTCPSISNFKPFIPTVKSAKPHRRHVARALNEESKTSLDGASKPDIEYLEARAGVGRRARRSTDERFNTQPVTKPKPKPKDWDSMTFQEKLLEIYVGEKGYVHLFWADPSVCLCTPSSVHSLCKLEANMFLSSAYLML